jgi:hypothetical protein
MPAAGFKFIRQTINPSPGGLARLLIKYFQST